MAIVAFTVLYLVSHFPGTFNLVPTLFEKIKICSWEPEGLLIAVNVSKQH